ncbi:MAG: glycosyltransferase family 2 protein [Anaerolineaceae bacterium]
MAVETPKILILIPAYNEHAHIARVVEEASLYLPVLVVDDGSSDNTSEISQQNGAYVIRQEPNQGKGAAMVRGFEYALENGYEAVITLDGDGQHAPDEIPSFVNEFTRKHCDLIIGERDFRKMPLIRMLSNSIGTRMISWAMGQYIPDNQSGYRLISAKLMQSMLSSHQHGFEFEVEMILRCVIENYKLNWVRIKTIYGDQKSHIRPIRHGLGFLMITLKARKIVHNHVK